MKYVELDKTPDGNLRLTWADGVSQQDKDELRDRAEMYGYFQAESEAVEYQLQNGWEWLRPEDIGALTSDTTPIFSDEVHYDDDGIVESVGRVYWDANYQVRSFLDDLLRDGVATLQGVD